MRLANPWFLLLLLIPLVRAWLRWRADHRPGGAFAWVSGGLLEGVPRSWRARAAPLPGWLELAGMVLVVVALARPQLDKGKEQVRLKSRNIIVALDISSSMKATDFQPGNRLEVARATLREFVKRREGDLVGLVIFSGKAFLQAPLTSDMTLIGRMLDLTDIGQLPDGTAIGTALAVSLNQLKQLPPASSTIVLITDGAENTGTPKLSQATEMARALGVRVHAIGLTSADTTSYELNGVWSVRTKAAKLSAVDERTLRQVAERTGGTFARATDPAALDSIMRAIDPLERVEVPVREVRDRHELFPAVLGTGLFLLVMQALLAATWLRRVP
jgi:Ca-activated chloride channel family protein